MPVISGLGWTFDTVASTYEKFRPGYVDELYRTLFDYIPIGENSRVVEVGSGGGQATAPLVQTGCCFTAVECGEAFCRRLRERFGDWQNVSVIQAKFEDVSFEANAYDLVYSASAFHWVPEKTGYEKAYSMLRPGGAFARFANHPYRDKGKPELSAEMDELYHAYYDRFYQRERSVIREYTEEEARDRAMIAAGYGFSDIRYALFQRQRVFSAQEYVKLLGTYSDHIAMEEAIRMPFFAAIEDAINRHGGSMTIYDTIDLQLARKEE